MVCSRSVLSLIFLFSFICNACAADVVTTARGKHYHHAGCLKIQNKKTALLDEQQAKNRGLRPCPICFQAKR